MKPRYLKSVINLIITGILLFFLWKRFNIDLNDIREIFLQANIILMMFSLLSLIVLFVLKSMRWKYILHSFDYHYSFYKSFIAYFSSFAIGVFTPGRLGEFTRLYYPKRDVGISSIDGLITVLLDRVYDLFFLMMIAIAAFFYFFFQTSFVISISVAAVMLILGIRISFYFARKIHLNSSNKFAKIVELATLILEFLNRPRHLFAWLCTMLAYITFFIGNYLLFHALNINITMIHTILVIALVSIVVLLPISIAGFGTRETGLIFLLGLLGFEANSAISFSLIQFFIFSIAGGLIGIIIFGFNPLPINKIFEDIKKVKTHFIRK